MREDYYKGGTPLPIFWRGVVPLRKRLVLIGGVGRATDRSMTRLLAAIVVTLASCAVPIKYQTFTLPETHTDVIWVIRNGALYRCEGEEKGPRCLPAQFVEPPRRIIQRD